MADQVNRQRLISLLTMPPKKIATLDENDLIKTIEEVDAIRLESVKDGRFLGNLKRRW